MVTVTSKGMLLEASSLEVPGAMWYRAPWILLKPRIRLAL